MKSKHNGRSTSTLRIGDRVTLSELGRSRAPKIRASAGVLVRLPKPASGGGAVEVLFDGNRTPTRLHVSYIEGLGSEEPAALGTFSG